MALLTIGILENNTHKRFDYENKIGLYLLLLRFNCMDGDRLFSFV